MSHLEKQFLELLPDSLRDLDYEYWSDFSQIEQSCKWLKNCANILDVGSGVGKFCIIGTQLLSSNFFGIEKNRRLHTQANVTLSHLTKHRVNFILGDLFKLPLSRYDGLYIYNPFVENISIGKKIDNSIAYDEKLYNDLHDQLMIRLDLLKSDSLVVNNSLVTDYFSDKFELVDVHSDPSLTLWKKII